MKILHRYILREFFRSFLLSLGTIFSILLVIHCILLLHRHGVELRHAMKILPFVIPNVMSYMVSISLISACALTFGRMEQDNELPALSWCGVHLRVLVIPVVIFAFGASLFCLWINHDVAPFAVRRRARFLKEALQELVVLKLSLGQREIQLGRTRLHIAKVRDGVFYGVSLVSLDKQNRPERIISARECRFNYDEGAGEIQLQFEGASGLLLDYKKEGTRIYKPVGSQYLYSYDLTTLQGQGKRVASYSMEELIQRDMELQYIRTIPDLDTAKIESDIEWYETRKHFDGDLQLEVASTIASALCEEQSYRWDEPSYLEQKTHMKTMRERSDLSELQAEELAMLETSIGLFKRRIRARDKFFKDSREEFYKVGAQMMFRSALGWAPLALSLLAIPMAIFGRHANRIVSFFFCALPVFVVYYPVMITGNALAIMGHLPPIPALWASNLLVIVIGLVLMQKVFRR